MAKNNYTIVNIQFLKKPNCQRTKKEIILVLSAFCIIFCQLGFTVLGGSKPASLTKRSQVIRQLPCLVTRLTIV